MLRLHGERIAVDDALQHRRRVHKQPYAHILRQSPAVIAGFKLVRHGLNAVDRQLLLHMRRDIAQALRQQADRLAAGGLLLPRESICLVSMPQSSTMEAMAMMPSRLNTRSAVMNGTPGMFGSTVPDHEPQGASVLLGQLFHAVERADRDDVQARDIGKPLLQDLLNGAGAAMPVMQVDRMTFSGVCSAYFSRSAGRSRPEVWNR